MSDLPTEILREIFAYFSSPLRVSQAYRFPWYLGQVCSRWRALFFSMQSTFWRKIEIGRDYNPWLGRLMPSPERVTTILAFFLNNRTQGAPFSFSFFHPNGYRQEKKHMRRILKDLLDYSRQWEEVSIRLQLADLNLLRDAKGHLPLLKRLDIVVDNDYRGMVPHPSLTIFEDAPLLTHVVVGGIFAWEFDWPSLTILSIGYLQNLTRTFAILQKTVNLVELTVSHVVYNGDVAISGLIHLPHLKYLFTRGDGLLTVLETPALRRLEIWTSQDASSVAKARVVVDFFHRSRLKLALVENGKSERCVLLHTSTI
jgi:hypothetical protein